MTESAPRRATAIDRLGDGYKLHDTKCAALMGYGLKGKAEEGQIIVMIPTAEPEAKDG